MSLQSLEGKAYVDIVTYRTSGAKVSTPVWFVLKDGHLYAWTEADSGKAKRIRRNPKVALAPCKMNGTPTGPYFDGIASILPDDSSPDLRQAFKSKYGLMLTLSRLFSRSRGAKRIFLEISPA